MNIISITWFVFGLFGQSSFRLTLAMRIPFTHWCRVLTSSQHRYLMYCDFFWICGCCKKEVNTCFTILLRQKVFILNRRTFLHSAEKEEKEEAGTGLHLQGQAVVGRSLVFAAVVLPVIHVNMVQLQEAHQISGRLQRGRHGRTH